MGRLYSIDTASAVKRYVEETGRAVRAGRTLPGSTFSLRDAADELGVSWTSLRTQFDRLERDGLLAVGRTGVATVAPLDPEEVDAISRLMRATVPALIAQASTRTTRSITRRIQRDGARIHHLPTDRRYAALTALLTDLLRPAGNPVALQQFSLLSAGLERYHHIGVCDLIEKQDEDFLRFRETREELHGMLLLGDAEQVFRVSDRLVAAFARFGTHSLTRAPVSGPGSRAFAGKAPILRLV